MREIKFRAWDTKYNSFDDRINGLKLEDFGELGFTLTSNDFIFLQYTGLHDCYGKEIFEGDILESNWNGKKIVVEMYDGEWVSCPDGSSTNGKEGDWKYAGTEIIGNIYENSDLLST